MMSEHSHSRTGSKVAIDIGTKFIEHKTGIR